MVLLIRIIAIFCFLVPISSNAAKKELVFNDPTNVPFTTPQGNGYLDQIYKEVFRRLGYTIKFVRLPAERALRSVNEGVVDGDISRIAGLSKQYPELVRVPEKVMDMNFIAFTRKPVSQPASWDALKTLEVGYIKGWKIFEANVPEGTSLLALRDHKQMFDMIKRNRLQVILYSQYMGLAYARQSKFEDIYPWLPPLASKQMFLYVHKRHKRLVPRIAATLRDMKKEGFVKRVYKNTLLSLEN